MLLRPAGLGGVRRPRFPAFTAKVTARALTEVGGLIESGHLLPVIDRAYPLSDAAAAVALVEGGSPAGKVIVMVNHPRRTGHPR